MTFLVHRSEKARHFVLRVGGGESLPDVLATVLRSEQVMCGWLRASGVLADVDLRAFNAERGGLGGVRRIAGPLQVLSLEGGAGLGDQGEPTVSLRALLARETDSGLETLAGEITSARAIAIEAIVTVFDDLALERTFDVTAGVSLFAPGPPSSSSALARGSEPIIGRAAPAPARPAAVAPAQVNPAPAQAGWSTALDASADTTREAAGRPRTAASSGATSSTNTAVPLRPARPGVTYLDAPVPEAGDVVEHFAFGSCEVIKSEGDRLHLRVGKEGRIREIALEMLRVTRLDDVAGKHHFKLERRM